MAPKRGPRHLEVPDGLGKQFVKLTERQVTSLPPELELIQGDLLTASWAERAGASWEEISKAAVWSSSHAFIKHYSVQMLSSQDLSFGRKVLQAVVPP